MKIKHKTVCVANDGTEFDLQADCELHEELLYIAGMLEEDVNHYQDNFRGTPYEIAVIFKSILDRILEKRHEENMRQYVPWRNCKEY